MKNLLQYSVLLLVMSTLSACSTVVKEPNNEVDKSVTTVSSEDSTDITTIETVIDQVEKPNWDSSKTRELDDYILKTWGPNLGQAYKSYTPEASGNFYGVTIPNDLLKKTLDTASKPIPNVNGIIPYWVWSEDGNVDSGAEAVVAVYSDIETAPYPTAHLYYFTLVDGEPLVLITEQNQGNSEGQLYFRETKNEDLKAFFSHLVKLEEE